MASANWGAVAASVGSALALIGANIAISELADRSSDRAVRWLGGRLGWLVGRFSSRRESVYVFSEPTLEQRLEELSRTMTTSAQLIALVTAEMDLRRIEVERLERERLQAEATRTLTDEQLFAVRAQLVEAVRPETNRGIKWSVVIGLLGFLAGALAALAVALFVHPAG